MLVSDGAGNDWLRCGDNSGVNRLCAAAYLLFVKVFALIECNGMRGFVC